MVYTLFTSGLQGLLTPVASLRVASGIPLNEAAELHVRREPRRLRKEGCGPQRQQGYAHVRLIGDRHDDDGNPGAPGDDLAVDDTSVGSGPSSVPASPRLSLTGREHSSVARGGGRVARGAKTAWRDGPYRSGSGCQSS